MKDHGPGTEQPSGLLVASYNVQKCVGLDLRRDPARTMAVIGELGADVVALQEGDRRFGNRAPLLDRDHLREITGLEPVPLPLPGIGGGHGWHGNILLTRGAEVEQVRQLVLPGLEPRGALVADLALEAGRLRVVAAHLGLLRASRAQQARAIVAALQEGDPRPVLLLGDLNEWRTGPRSSLRLLEAELGRSETRVRSFPAGLPMLSLDRIYAAPRGLLGRMERHDSPLARIASDHLPVKARLYLGQVELDPPRAGPSADRGMP